MTEIKKLTKIVLLVYAIIWFVLGTMLVFLYDLVLNPEGWTNPYLPRMFGGVNYVSAIVAVVLLRKKEWEEIKLVFAYFIGLIIMEIIIEISLLSIFFSTFGADWIPLNASTIILEAVLLTLGIIAYIKQRS